MKKLFIVLAAALIAFSANAQLRVEGGLSLGGYNKNDNFNAKAGFVGRVLYDFSVGASASGEEFFLSVGAGYLMNNSQVKNDSGNCITNWLQVPVTFGSFYKLGSGSLYGALGVYYAYCLSGKVTNNGNSINIVSNDISSVNVFKRNDFGYMAQFGYVFPMNLGIYFGYNGGFLNIAAQSNSNAKNSIIEIGVLYKF